VTKYTVVEDDELIMKPIVFVIFAIAALFSRCANKDALPSMEKMIIGNWQAVTVDGHQMAAEWGFTYEGSIKFYPDHSFAENVGANPINVFKLGTWELKNNDRSIIFYSVMDDSGTIKRDTTEFSVSIDLMGKLILQNSQNLIRHKRIE
jgi:hypothetical protein